MLSHAHSELRGAEYVVFADANRRYTDCSEPVCRLLGYSREELLKLTIDDVSYTADVSKRFEQFLRQGTQDGEFVLKHKNGSPIPIRYCSYVFKDGCHAAAWSPIKDWREQYLAALLELDPAKFKQRIEVALAAVRHQMGEFERNASAWRTSVRRFATPSPLCKLCSGATKRTRGNPGTFLAQISASYGTETISWGG